MELSVLNVIIVMLVCAMTAFMSHMGMAVFHDGIRPVIPEYIEGRMHRGEMASIAFGLSVGSTLYFEGCEKKGKKRR